MGASVDALHADKLGRAAMVQEVAVGTGKVVKVTGIENMGRVATVLLREIKQNASRRSRALFPRCTVCCSLSSQEALPYLWWWSPRSGDGSAAGEVCQDS